MKKVILFFFSLCLISCSSGSDSSSGISSSNESVFSYDKSFFDETNLQYPDDLVVPDKYNTGVDSSVSLSKLASSKNINGLFITVDVRNDNKTNQYLITSYNENLTKLPDEVTVENYDFSDRPMVSNSGNRFASKKTIHFKNCKFKSFRNPPNEDNKLWFTFDHCSFAGGINEAQIELNHCYIGGFTADGMNPTRYFKCKNSYIADLFNTATSGEVHIDGFQIYGRNSIAGGYIYFDNVRFEIPSIYVANQAKGTGVNACVMFQLEFGNVENCLFKNLFINGGGKWYPIYLTKGKTSGKWLQRNLSLKNVFVSNNFGKIYYPSNYDEKAIVENVNHSDLLYVSSVWKDSSGKTHIICSNDTMYKSTLLVKTDKGDFEFEIPRCPSNWNLNGEINKSKDVNNGKGEDDSFLKDEKGKLYTTYKFFDMPFDVDCVINENITKLVCFDKENNKQIRSVKL